MFRVLAQLFKIKAFSFNWLFVIAFTAPYASVSLFSCLASTFPFNVWLVQLSQNSFVFSTSPGTTSSMWSHLSIPTRKLRAWWISARQFSHLLAVLRKDLSVSGSIFFCDCSFPAFFGLSQVMINQHLYASGRCSALSFYKSTWKPPCFPCGFTDGLANIFAKAMKSARLSALLIDGGISPRAYHGSPSSSSSSSTD